MKPISKELYEEIKIRIKNKIDISDLIVDRDIRNLDLSNSIISTFRAVDGNISGCNFSNSILGNDKDIFTIIRTNMENCNFNGARFIGKTWMRSCNAKNCNFKNADIASVSYEYSNFQGSDFCGSKITIDSRGGVGAIFPTNILRNLVKEWANKIKIEE